MPCQQPADNSVDVDSLARLPNYFSCVQEPSEALVFADICDLIEKWGRIPMDETFGVSCSNLILLSML